MMRAPFYVVNLTLLCVTLMSTLCLVLCFENDADHQRVPGLNFKETLDHSRWTPFNDRIALKELLEMYNAEPLWKRAPAAGFYGMRGKKVPGQNFFGMRGKKGPSGFLGVRGKKMESRFLGLHDGFEPLEVVGDNLGDLWSSKEAIENSLAAHKNEQLLGDNLLADHFVDNNKRAPADGFMGLRGKRNTSPKGDTSPPTKTNNNNVALH